MPIDATEQTQALNWLPPAPPTPLIFDDEEPLETNRHRIAMNVLIRSLKQGWSEKQNYFVGGNMFIYYSSQQLRNRDFRRPDFFVVLNVKSDPTCKGWVVWEEGGRYPDVVIELLSESTAEVDKDVKKNLYERVFKTRDYFVFDLFDSQSLQGWSLHDQLQYQLIVANERGWL
ncbi:Uma2 family endonuclease [Oscillatoria sp. FACHB-1407]|uniref:Uma2 family endonuclease n=1 Tax=Oscillatoria sp. FACHB-1407 TaxID=2692847 RepID=UPI002816607C|nr:Uma2 family endonuclease [Oscillatoria sp. FACHB-1407]